MHPTVIAVRGAAAAPQSCCHSMQHSTQWLLVMCAALALISASCSDLAHLVIFGLMKTGRCWVRAGQERAAGGRAGRAAGGARRGR